MVKYKDHRLDRVFAALADPTRREILARLGAQQSLSITDIARPLPQKLPGIMKHLNVLHDAGLIARRKSGRTVSIVLATGPMREAISWLQRYEQFWSHRLDRLVTLLDGKPSGE
jgi:DNA-binding transcriptional ArsR family regulator